MTAARGGVVTLAGSAGVFALQFASVAILSRLLTPEDFGLVAMVTVFVALGNLLRDFGMPMAALQASDLSRQQASNLFWMNVVLAAAAAVTLAGVTPLLVALYSEPRLTGIVPVLAIIILINGVASQIQIDLARGMRFFALVVTDLLGQASGLAIAIWLAVAGVGYWALVAQALTAALLTLMTRWVVSRWWPMRPRKGHGSAPLFRSGARLGAAYLLTYLQSNADTLVIGSLLGAQQLGYYNRAFQALAAPGNRMLDPLTQVVIPAANKARADGRDPQLMLLRLQFAVGCLMVWVFAVAAGAAPVLIPLILGNGWEATVDVFRILAVGGSVWVFCFVTYWAFLLGSLNKELLLSNAVTKPLSVVLLCMGVGFGIRGVAIGYVVGMTLSWPINLAWLARSVKFPAWRFAWNGLAILGSGALCALVADTCMTATTQFGPIISLLASAASGTLAMALPIAVVPQLRTQALASARLARSVFGSMGTLG